jgi:hypothetical protein
LGVSASRLILERVNGFLHSKITSIFWLWKKLVSVTVE